MTESGLRAARPLYLNTITVKQRVGLADKFRLAKACGYAGLELWMHDVAPQALGEADLREAGERYGLGAVDPEACIETALALAREFDLRLLGLCPPSAAAVRWSTGLDRQVLASLDKTIAVCAGLGAGYVALPMLGDKASVQGIADNLRRLGALASRHGVRIGLEPVGHVERCNRLVDALEILRLADLGAGAGLIVDAFHFFRAGQTLADLAALSREQIVAVHLNDAQDRPREALFGHRHRVYPGAGIWDIRGFCQALLSAGYEGPFVIEILNPAYWEQQAETVGKTAYQASAAVLGGALH